MLSKIKMKNRAYHQFLKRKDQQNKSKNACRKAVTDYEKSLLREVKSNPKAFSRYAKNKLNFKNAIPDLVHKSKILSDVDGKEKAFKKQKNKLDNLNPYKSPG